MPTKAKIKKKTTAKKSSPNEPNKAASNKLDNKVTVFVGVKNVGKTEAAIEFLESHSDKKVIIFDVNNAFGDYRTHDNKRINIYRIGNDDVARFNKQTAIETRRIVPLDSIGQQLSTEAIEELLVKVLTEFNDGYVFLGEPNVVFGNNIPQSIRSLVFRKNHNTLFCVQSLSRISIAIDSIDTVRMYRQLGDMESLRAKLDDKFPLFKLAQLIVDEQYNSGNIRYYATIDVANQKLKDVTRDKFDIAVLTYLQLYPRVLRDKLNEEDIFTGEKKYNRIGAIDQLKYEFSKQYLN